MTKIAAQCTRHCAALVLRTPPSFSPCSSSVVIELNHFCWIFVFAILSPRCWLEWSVIVFVPRFICIMPQIISLSISSCGASLLITVVRLMDLWILDLLLPHSSNISLALVPSSFFPLLSFSCLLFVADCHVNFPPFLSSLHSHFVDCCVTFFQSALSDKLTFPLFLCTLRVPPSGSMGACSWSLNECDSCRCQVFSRENFQLAQRQCLWILLPF